MTSATRKVPLRLGPLSAEEFAVSRSYLRWLCPDGHLCRPGEVIAWCNVGLFSNPKHRAAATPFPEEGWDFQVALAPRVGGRLRKARGVSRGGYFDLQHGHHPWAPETVIGHLECAGEAPAGDPSAAGRLRLLLLAGRRVTDAAEVRWGPLTGWHDRSRGWWADGEADFGTLLSLGTCEQLHVVRGEGGAFFEFFKAAPGPAQVVFTPDDVSVPRAAVLLSQLERTQEGREQISQDMADRFGALACGAGAGGGAVSAGWIYAGALLKAVNRSPLVDEYNVLTPAGLRRTGPPSAVLLSLHSEQAPLLRHRRLGYLVSCHLFRANAGGALLFEWLRNEFELLRPTPDQIRSHYLTLIDALRARAGPHLLVLNMVTTTDIDDVFCYAHFEPPLGDTLPTVRARELNLMLYQVARERDISVVDVDALAADLGVRRHVPDGVHQSGRLQRAVRAQVLRILRERGVPGFGPPPPRPPESFPDGSPPLDEGWMGNASQNP
jgi:hypothetical protein